MDPVSLIGLGLSATGLLGRFLGKSEEDRRREEEKANAEKVQKTLDFLAAQKMKSNKEGVREHGQQTKSMVAQATQAAASRAAASGRSGETESYVLPAAGQAASVGNQATSRFIQNNNQMYDQAAINAQMGGLQADLRPREQDTNWTDYAIPMGMAALKYGMSQPPETSTDKGIDMTEPIITKPNISNPEPLPGGEVAPEPFRIPTNEIPGSGSDVPRDPQFDFNTKGWEDRKRAYLRLRSGSIFGKY